MTQQKQFLTAIDRDEAQARFRSALNLVPIAAEVVGLNQALGRVLAESVTSTTNVPYFDRSNFDGFALNAADVFGATENDPIELKLLPETIPAGVAPNCEISSGLAVSISTGGMIPRGANTVCLLENTETRKTGSGDRLVVRKPVHSGSGISFAGSDLAKGEMVLRRGQTLTSRETGLLAAIGKAQVEVFRKPKVAVISTGNEIIEPGTQIGPGLVYDSNARIISDAVTEAGGEPLEMGIAIDDVDQLGAVVAESLEIADLVLLSGGTSKGEGDLTYQVVSQFDDPGIVAHGVALKPGKPICLAVTQNKPLVVLPGFPTSAIFTFHEFVAPVIRVLAGQSEFDDPLTLKAELATRVNSEIGRTEYLLVGLLNQVAAVETGVSVQPERSEQPQTKLRAYPMGKGSGSVTTFSRADGFITIDRHVEIIEEGSLVDVKKIGNETRSADLVVIGSHCIGIDYLLGEMQSRGMTSKIFAVGSTAGLNAAKKGDCDIAGIHLYDPASGSYNRPFASDEVVLFDGYTRQQGIVLRPDEDRVPDPKLNAETLFGVIASAENLLMINRNQGSGTRFLIDKLMQEFLAGVQPRGYEIQASNHHAVCSAVAQGRADWGVAIEAVAIDHGLRFIPIEQEKFDFAVPRSRLATDPVREFLNLLGDPAVKKVLARKGLVM